MVKSHNEEVLFDHLQAKAFRYIPFGRIILAPAQNIKKIKIEAFMSYIMINHIASRMDNHVVSAINIEDLSEQIELLPKFSVNPTIIAQLVDKEPANFTGSDLMLGSWIKVELKAEAYPQVNVLTNLYNSENVQFQKEPKIIEKVMILIWGWYYKEMDFLGNLDEGFQVANIPSSSYTVHPGQWIEQWMIAWKKALFPAHREETDMRKSLNSMARCSEQRAVPQGSFITFKSLRTRIFKGEGFAMTLIHPSNELESGGNTTDVISDITTNNTENTPRDIKGGPDKICISSNTLEAAAKGISSNTLEAAAKSIPSNTLEAAAKGVLGCRIVGEAQSKSSLPTGITSHVNNPRLDHNDWKGSQLESDSSM